MTADNIYVFVVCGDDEHISTLNFSLTYLKHFTKNKICVVTDLSRNNQKIKHDSVIDVRTPEHFSHHQASIFLKTGLHKFLDMSHNYCYLDTDVIAVSEEVDSIFEQFIPPVVFASDHCALREFSPYAVNCNCNALKIEKYAILDALQHKHNPNMQITDTFLQDKAKKLTANFYLKRKKRLSYFLLMLRYFLSGRFFKLYEEFYYDKRKKVWYYMDGRAVLYAISGYYRKIEKESFFKWDKKQQIWRDDTGENAYIAYCNHLSEMIKDKFNIEVTDKNWPHWNGGVFLFNKTSVDFLEVWHSMTLEIFNEPEWRVRDQGTLIATAWKFALNNHKRLPSKYNFIADYHKKNLIFDKEKGFSTDKFKTIIKPCFLHVYHEFGRKGWDVWDAVESLLSSQNKEN